MDVVALTSNGPLRSVASALLSTCPWSKTTCLSLACVQLIEILYYSCVGSVAVDGMCGKSLGETAWGERGFDHG